MEIILLEKIEKLGQMGDVVQVKAGYARNYLLPKGKALRATEANKTHFEGQRAQLEADNLETRSEAEKLGKKLDGLSVIMIRQAGEAGQLYGSVNARDIAGGITEAGFTITRQQIELPHPIKALGLFDIRVALHPEISVVVSANVARSDEEAKIQAKTGKAIVGTEEKDAEEAAAHTPAEDTAAQEEAAKEAVAEQVDEIFEEGAAPQPVAEEDAEVAPSEEGGEEGGKEEKSE